ncbi:polymorphic toxin-type HINT domain-containing protein [Intestinibacter bartlettii]|uniref:polymorphic toxin-type HINT domain-containing protein n=1 Tax=Intestinibacter bartlettii TaxID=261299 RepID=UPI002901ACE3|nr:polymorphic toxin-type HINT domain-containing protein [Intestinibacter bartlettii]MDU1253728.1 polymorphic toxin-type HINT domain-containing protein [Peptostreptococcaceae bacterium]
MHFVSKITKKGCFVEGTLVLTENGLVPIEDIEVGDYVWAENPETGEIELKEVLNTFEKQVDTIVTITIDGEKIQTTEAHLFYVEGTGWIPASMLQEGDTLSLEDGREVPVQSIETITYNHYVNVYNFEVEDFHTYYVSDVSVLTHNRTPCQKLKRMDTKNKYWNKKAKYDGFTIYHLHHLIQMNEGTLAEVSASLHSSKTGILHINGNKIQSGINRKEFANYTKRYWRRRAKDFY